MILIVDNYDSFTWNLVQRLGELDPGLDIRVVRNDEVDAAAVLGMAAASGVDRLTHLIISPGPCTPAEAGRSPEIVRALAGAVPTLGVCLGHQTIGAVSGMTVVRHPVPVHGKTSPIHHDGRGVFAGLPNPFDATRYHSLVVRADSVPTVDRGGAWEVSAWTDEPDGAGGTRRVVMGLRRVWGEGEHPAMPLEGVQFHPESFLTEAGPRLLANFLAMGARDATEGAA